jgi:hypothetical protein
VSEIGFWIGKTHPVQLLIIDPLFEEANRMRRTLAQVMRALDAEGIGSLIPDLCGTGESLRPVSDTTLAIWRQDVAGASKLLANGGQQVLCVSFRGGSLIDDAAKTSHWWRCAPETGPRIVRDLRRTQMAGHGDADKLAGHSLPAGFVAELEAAIPLPVSPLHVVRLETDAADADDRIAGSPIWRRAEPGEDPELTAAIVRSLIQWVHQCVAA